MGWPGFGSPSSHTPSCQSTYSTHTNASAWDYRSAEFLYRMSRMNRLYPNIMTSEMLRSMSQTVQTGGSFESIARLVEGRRVEVQRTITDLQTRQTAAASGRSGSSGFSFGGGGSSGGGGGRW
jgi:uncharacterized membrane protein YgcG